MKRFGSEFVFEMLVVFSVFFTNSAQAEIFDFTNFTNFNFSITPSSGPILSGNPITFSWNITKANMTDCYIYEHNGSIIIFNDLPLVGTRTFVPPAKGRIEYWLRCSGIWPDDYMDDEVVFIQPQCIGTMPANAHFCVKSGSIDDGGASYYLTGGDKPIDFVGSCSGLTNTNNNVCKAGCNSGYTQAGGSCVPIVKGVCGSPIGQNGVLDTLSAGSCNSGTYRSFTTNTLSWSWKCSGNDGTSVDCSVLKADPVINNFSASSSSITSGQSTTLSWNTSHVKQCSISGLVSAVGLNGTQTDSPTSTKTYKLSCLGFNSKTVEKSLTVSVCSPTWSPLITSVCAGQTFTQTNSCDGSIRVVTGTNTGGTFSPLANTKCLGESFIQTNSCTSQIATGSNASLCAQPPVISSFTATPTSIESGESSKLVWFVSNADSCTASGGWSDSKSKVSGFQSIFPASTATYTLTCSKVGFSDVAKSVTVTVSCNPTWSPSIASVCTGQTFTQTNSCDGSTRTMTGTKAETWSPAESTVCSGTSFTQTSTCGRTRTATGTGTASWAPATSTVCLGQTFTQSDGCGNVKQATGTNTGGTFSPLADTKCLGESFIQTNSCTSKIATGSNSSLCTTDGLCGPPNGESRTTLSDGSCSAGTYDQFYGTGPWSWKCLGLNGGQDDSCIVNAPVNGQCGSDDGKTLSSAPTDACYVGTPIGLSGSGPWSWTCSGAFGGSPSSTCSAQIESVDASINTNTWKEVAP